MHLLKSVLTFALLSAGTLCADAAGPASIHIWPDGAPNDHGIKATEEEKTDWNVVDDPLLYIYPSADPDGLVVLMTPGGGYRHLGMENEGFSFTPWFNRQDITTAILQYRMPRGHDDVPLSDVHQAMRLLRERYPNSRIGIMGFSAGGHLASTAATHYTDSVTRPDFQILYYPVVTMGKGTHAGSRNHLLGDNPSSEKIKYYSNELQVTSDTPPAFILHSSDDTVVPVSNSLNYYKALVDAGVPASMHIYPVGGHGWGWWDGFKYKPMWAAELEYWLDAFKKK